MLHRDSRLRLCTLFVLCFAQIAQPNNSHKHSAAAVNCVYEISAMATASELSVGSTHTAEQPHGMLSSALAFQHASFVAPQQMHYQWVSHWFC